MNLKGQLKQCFRNMNISTIFGTQNVTFLASVPFVKFPELKERFEQRKRWRIIDRECSYFETKWKSTSRDTSYRFIFVRRKARRKYEGPLQLYFIELRDFNFDYKVIITNKTESTKDVVQLHNGRGSQETIFGDAKGDCGFNVIAT